MKKSLFKRFLAAFLIPVLLIMLYHLFVMTRFMKDNREKTQSYATGMIKSVGQNIERSFENLCNAGKTFSYSLEVQKMAAGLTPVGPSGIKELLTMTQAYNADMQGVLLTDSTGATHGLQGYINSTVEAKVNEIAQSHFAGSEMYSFIIFTESNTNYLMHCAPVFATQITMKYGRKIGTISILCKADHLIDILNAADNMYMEILSQDGSVSFLQNARLISEGQQKFFNQNGEHVYTQLIKDSNLLLRGTPIDVRMDAEMELYLLYFLFSIIIALLSCAFLAFAVHFLFLKPIAKMNHAIAALENGDSSQRLRYLPDNEIGSIGIHINRLLDTIHTLNYSVVESRESLYQMELMKRKTQLYAYQSQINPHFLYNMLQCMRGIALYHEVNQIADICNSMATIFRYSIKGENLVSLQKELEVTRHYLDMIRVRYQDKIQYSIEVNPAYYNCNIMKLTLQPIIENAVEHGLGPKGYEGRIIISSYQGNGCLLVDVANNGQIIAPEKLRELRDMLDKPVQSELLETEDAHIGIINVHDKLRLAFGARYGLNVFCREGYTIFTIRLPL